METQTPNKRARATSKPSKLSSFVGNRPRITKPEIEHILDQTKLSLSWTGKRILWTSLNRIARNSWGASRAERPSQIAKILERVAKLTASLLSELEDSEYNVQWRLTLAGVAADQGLLEAPTYSVALNRAIAAGLVKGEDRRQYKQLRAALDGIRFIGRLSAAELRRTKAQISKDKRNYSGHPETTALVNALAITFAMAWRRPPGTDPDGPFSRLLDSCGTLFRIPHNAGVPLGSKPKSTLGSKLVNRWKESPIRGLVDEATLSGKNDVLAKLYNKTFPSFLGRRWDLPRETKV